MNELILKFNFAITAACILFFFSFEEKPKHPPSLVSLAESPKRNFSSILQELRENSNLRKLVIAYALIIGNILSYGMMLSTVFAPFGQNVS